MVSVGRILKDHPTPCHGLGCPQQTRLLTAPSNLALSTSRDGENACYQLSEACSQEDKCFQSAKVNTCTITACWGGTGPSDWATRTTTNRVNSKRNTQESTGLKQLTPSLLSSFLQTPADSPRRSHLLEFTRQEPLIPAPISKFTNKEVWYFRVQPAGG